MHQSLDVEFIDRYDLKLRDPVVVPGYYSIDHFACIIAVEDIMDCFNEHTARHIQPLPVFGNPTGHFEIELLKVTRKKFAIDINPRLVYHKNAPIVHSCHTE